EARKRKQKAAAEDAEPDEDDDEEGGKGRKKPIRDAWGRPTGAFFPDAAARQRCEDARAQTMREQAIAWRSQQDAPKWWEPAQGSWQRNEGRGAKPGDECTINGQRGKLVVVNNDLVCKPLPQAGAETLQPTNDPIEGKRRKDEAYNAMLADQASAWRRSSG